MPEARPRVAHSRPFLGAAEERAALRVLRSGQLASGPEVEKLEGELAARLGFAHAVAVSSGSAALHLALLALGVGRGDVVVAPSYVCLAVLNTIRYVQARERLVDTEPRSFHIDAAAAARAAAGAKAAIVPHLFGHAASLDPLLKT